MTRLAFVEPPYGLGPIVDFDLEPVADAAGLYALTGGTIRLFLLDAARHLPAYRPIIAEADLADLGDAVGVTVYVVVNPAEGAWSVNLAAPVLVGAGGRARQVILDRGDWPVRTPLAAALAA